MKRYIVIIISVFLCSITVRAKVNYDYETIEAMTAAFNTEAATELLLQSDTKYILKKYGDIALSSTTVFGSKYNDRKALTNVGIWVNSDENYYYKRIVNLVGNCILPKSWSVIKLLFKDPQKIYYWLPYIMNLTYDTKSLCQSFESVVTNGKLSFSMLDFLEVNPEIKDILDLQEFNKVDWETMFGDISDNFSLDNIKEDINTLVSGAVSLATSGYENVKTNILGQNRLEGTVVNQIKSLYKIGKNLYSSYDSAGGNITTAILNITGTDPSKLFNISDYNMTKWTQSYLTEESDRAYTQRWYIYNTESGEEVLWEVSPQFTDSQKKGLVNASAGPTKDGDWYRVAIKTYFGLATFSQSSLDKAKQMAWDDFSEKYEAAKKTYKSKLEEDGYSASQTYSLKTQSYSVTPNFATWKGMWYAYAGKLSRSWNKNNVVYEDTYDSQKQSLDTFQKMFEEQLAYYNNNDDGIIYKIGKDEKKYYEVTDASKLKGIATVEIQANCTDYTKILDGCPQWKENHYGDYFSHAKSKDGCGWLTSLSDDQQNAADDKSEMEQKKVDVDSTISSLKSTIASIDAQIKEYDDKIANTIDPTTVVNLKSARNDLYTQRDAYQSELDDQQELRNQIGQALDEMEEDEGIADDYNRMPAIFKACESFVKSWDDEGHWEGDTYVRTGKSSMGKSTLTLRAEFKKIRGTSYFLGIRVHRAIIAIDWKLESYTESVSSLEIVDISGMDEQTAADLVNNKVKQYASDYPDCSITTKKTKAENGENVETDDTIHLLWASDRLEVAKKIEAKLMSIFADLIQLEKFLHYKVTLKDCLKKAGIWPTIDERVGKKKSLTEVCKDRWDYYSDPNNRGKIYPSHSKWSDLIGKTN